MACCCVCVSERESVCGRASREEEERRAETEKEAESPLLKDKRRTHKRGRPRSPHARKHQHDLLSTLTHLTYRISSHEAPKTACAASRARRRHRCRRRGACVARPPLPSPIARLCERLEWSRRPRRPRVEVGPSAERESGEEEEARSSTSGGGGAARRQKRRAHVWRAEGARRSAEGARLSARASAAASVAPPARRPPPVAAAHPPVEAFTIARRHGWRGALGGQEGRKRG